METLNIWRAFFVCNDLTKPVVHFFPQSSGSSAPYGVNCTLTLFGGGLEARSITLEGARLNQPDGIRLDAVFPELQQRAQGLIGLEISLESANRRLDLGASQVIIELSKGKQSLRYFAAPVRNSSKASSQQLFPVLGSADTFTTIVAINAGARPAEVSICSAGSPKTNVSDQLSEPAELACSQTKIHSDSVAKLDGYSLVEFGGNANFGAVTNKSIPAGIGEIDALSRLAGVPIEPGVYSLNIANPEVSYYGLLRDMRTRALVSIQAL